MNSSTSLWVSYALEALTTGRHLRLGTSQAEMSWRSRGMLSLS